MAPESKIIHVHALAPAKPALGAPCNGCGVCCLSEPCPLGVLLSGRRSGACRAVRWNAQGAIYRCGAIESPAEVLPAALQWLKAPLAWVLRRLAGRWIAAGAGCDCDLVPEPAASTTIPASHASGAP